MLTQRHDDDHESLRFPERDGRPASPEQTVQIQIDPQIVASIGDLAVLRDVLRAPQVSDSLSPILIAIFEALRNVGAIAIEPAFDLTSLNLDSTLTEGELRRRRSFFDVRLRSDVDVVPAADVIRAVPFVLQAVVKPGEAPPWAHHGEPLLGHDDQNLRAQWYVFRVRANRVWSIATGHGVVIGDVDF